MNSLDPFITIHAGPTGVRIDQNRPSVTSLLRGMPAAAALARIPSLLPICGAAQALAARRAIEAARGEQPGETMEAEREASLWREQAHAATWRVTIDWPDVLGESRDLERMRQMLTAGNGPDAAAVLEAALPALQQVEDIAELLDWVARSQCGAARFLRRAMEQENDPERPAGTAHCAAGDALVERARTVFDNPGFDPLTPGDEAVEVGPAAMVRDPLIPALQSVSGLNPTTRRLLAQVLDSRCIARELRAIPGSGRATVESWPLAAGSGMGRAQTARGPVFHRVSLDPRDGETVTDWRVLAPTDWHFSPRGPLAHSVEDVAVGLPWLRFAVTGFDPCAPWEVVASAGRGERDA